MNYNQTLYQTVFNWYSFFIELISYNSATRYVKFLSLVALRPNAGHRLLLLEDSRSHKTTHRSPQDFSGQVIGSSQRPLPDIIQHSRQTSMPRRDSKPQSQEESDHRLAPQTTWTLGPAMYNQAVYNVVLKVFRQNVEELHDDLLSFTVIGFA